MKKKVWFVVSIIVLGAALLECTPQESISLSTSETTQARALAERRQDIAFRRASAIADYQARINRLQEEETGVNIDAEKLCFQLKKAHLPDPSSQYLLDEWKGILRRQK